MLLRSTGGPSGHGPALPELHKRLRWVAIFVVLSFLLLIGRLWQLQIVRGDSYFERTMGQVIKTEYLPSVRGMILDRKGVPLATNRIAFNVYATPADMTPEREAALGRLLKLSDDEIAKLHDRLEIGKKRGKDRPLLVLADQGRDRAALVEQARTRFPGVSIKHDPYRTYPAGDMAAHLVGYMTQMNASEVDHYAALGYDANELVGKYGLEAAWENYLRGKHGEEKYAVDARGERLDDEVAQALIDGPLKSDPVPGANLRLTIDADLQKVAEKAVAHTAAAALVVVEVKTGKIRAIVSKPSFDPNVMTGHLTPQEYELLKTDPRKPFIDKALHATYPPGSIFKFATAFAALEDGDSADEGIYCTGEYQLSGTTFRCNGTHGKLDLIGAIQHSCDVYFWKLAEHVGIDRIADVALDYGLGQPTTLGLNGDSAGRIPTKKWYEDHTHYKVGFATNASIGQGDVEVTVLQMAMAYAAIANGGTLYVPQVVESLESSQGETIMAFGPKATRNVKTPPAALDTWKKGMWKVTHEPGGTAFDHGHTDVVEVMGKTGTAEVKKHHHTDDSERSLEDWHPNASHAWFAGYAPADDPEIAIVVLVEHGGSGGRIAWPIAQRILDYYFGPKNKGAAK